MSNTLSYEVSLSPKGVLCLNSVEGSEKLHYFISIHKAFANDWREGWFHLAADKISLDRQPSLRFWQDIAKEYVTELCHLPEEMEFSSLEAPGPDRLNEWLLKMPPMIGGEYLSLSRLRKMWEELNLWVEQSAMEQGGIHQFLREQASKWQQVGRVCFHLAENKTDPDRPFAFLATYSTGFGATGKLKHLPLKKALEQYSTENNHQALVKLLTPVQEAADRCLWVKTLVNTAELYQPLAWSASKAYKLLKSVPELEESGLSVRIPNWWKCRSRPPVAVTIGSQSRPTLGVNAMLDFNVEVALGNETLSLEELRKLSSASEGIAYIRGQWVEVDSEKLQQALDHWKQVKQQANNGEISFIDGMRLLAGAPSSLQQKGVLEQQHSWVNVSAGEALSDLLKQLRNPSLLPTEKALENFNATLRPYQQEGVNWLCLLSGLGLGACLADDMGLGKTLQVLSLLVIQQQQSQGKPQHPSLLVVPASLLGNWRREAEHFTPSLKLFFVHPSETKHQTLLELATAPDDHLPGIDLV